MKISVRMVECFRAVMTASTVTSAAELLHTSQPAISRSIQQLESVVGLRLFDRVKNRLIPTAAALALFEEVQRTFKGLEHIVAFAKNLKGFGSGNVSIICAPAFSHGLISDVAARFLAKHEGVSLSIDTQPSWAIAEGLNAQRFDIGLAAFAMSLQGADSTLFAEPDEVCALPPGHPLATKDEITPHDLREQRFVYLGSASDPYRFRLDSAFKEAKVERRLAVETPNSATLCAMVLRGAGVGIVNPLTAMDFVDSGLVLRKLSVSMPFTSTLLRAKHRPSSPLVDRFVVELCAVRDEYLASVQKLLRRALPRNGK